MQLGEGRWRQIGETPRDVDQVVAVMLDQIEGIQHRLMATVFAPQRMEIRHALVAGDHRPRRRSETIVP
jgi:hypothetical protein